MFSRRHHILESFLLTRYTILVTCDYGRYNYEGCSLNAKVYTSLAPPYEGIEQLHSL
jgi:hypothetical protein